VEDTAMSIRKKYKVAWGAVERDGKTFWTRAGLAWEMEGATYVQLHSFPLSGKVCIKEGLADAVEVAVTAGKEAVQ
jgi:hypothetical protein